MVTPGLTVKEFEKLCQELGVLYILYKDNVDMAGNVYTIVEFPNNSETTLLFDERRAVTLNTA